MKKYKSILAIILMCLMVTVLGTYAWLSWRSIETGLKLTIGNIEDIRLTISPYKIETQIIPVLTYEEEEYVNVEIINNSESTKNAELFYEIDEIDEELISEDFMYTITRSVDNSSYEEYKSGNFSDVVIGEEFIILTESIPAGVEYEYRVYLWLNGENIEQGNFVGKTFSGELRGRLSDGQLFTQYTYSQISSNYSCSNTSAGTDPIFTYTGECEVVDDGDENWKVRFLTDGNFTSNADMMIDAFLVGGGGGGSGASNGGGGGGGGYTNTTFVNLQKDTPYEIVIGNGGSASENGMPTTAFNAIAEGGCGSTRSNGGSGGSGGGGFGVSAGSGGSNGGNGIAVTGQGGTGQGRTTCEFGEDNCSDNLLYAGGGGGSGVVGGSGGSGGGGAGASNGGGVPGGNGSVNTGGGGGGTANSTGGSGGSGIVIIRNTRNDDITELPSVGFDFTYTGNYLIVNDGNGNWRIKFLTSGTFTSSTDIEIDAFLVGGGGGGSSANAGGGGGGGGYTNTTLVNLQKDTPCEIVIGNGGSASENGMSTTAFNVIAEGGIGATSSNGGAGGSGGGGFGSTGGSGGSNGGNGITVTGQGGTGQGRTTCEFGEDGCIDELLYSGGGGGFGSTGGSGGSGGGGGGSYLDSGSGINGCVNTGGGGGGTSGFTGGSGGSGIVIIRNTRNNIGFDFTYTGSYVILYEGSGNWKMKFLTSGEFTPSANLAIDAFLVGGGGGGSNSNAGGSGGGGGGGYTLTEKNINLVSNQTYSIIVGDGGGPAQAGEDTSAFGVIAGGGKAATSSSGGNGGSGGGSKNNNGGSNGSDGTGKDSTHVGGKGQISLPGPNGETGSTKEFGEESGELYSGGGGGGSGGIGGDGGGASDSLSAEDNTGGGGGGGVISGTSPGGSGGSGIVIIRNKR